MDSFRFSGALQGLSELLHLDQLAHGSLCKEAQCTTLRRYASMTLTNLTFGHGPNKTLLCSIRPLLSVLSHQLASPNDDLRQVTHHYSSIIIPRDKSIAIWIHYSISSFQFSICKLKSIQNGHHLQIETEQELNLLIEEDVNWNGWNSDGWSFQSNLSINSKRNYEWIQVEIEDQLQ